MKKILKIKPQIIQNHLQSLDQKKGINNKVQPLINIANTDQYGAIYDKMRKEQFGGWSHIQVYEFFNRKTEYYLKKAIKNSQDYKGTQLPTKIEFLKLIKCKEGLKNIWPPDIRKPKEDGANSIKPENKLVDSIENKIKYDVNRNLTYQMFQKGWLEKSPGHGLVLTDFDIEGLKALSVDAIEKLASNKKDKIPIPGTSIKLSMKDYDIKKYLRPIVDSHKEDYCFIFRKSLLEKLVYIALATRIPKDCASRKKTKKFSRNEILKQDNKQLPPRY